MIDRANTLNKRMDMKKCSLYSVLAFSIVFLIMLILYKLFSYVPFGVNEKPNLPDMLGRME